MASEVKRPIDAKTHENGACKVAAVTSVNTGGSHQLDVSHSTMDGKDSVASTQHEHACRAASPLNSPSDLVAPTSSHSHRDNKNKATCSTQTKKRKRTADLNMNQISQNLSESKTHVPQRSKTQRSDYAGLELEELEKQTLLRYEIPRDDEGATTRAVSLLYNECSLVAISNWVSVSSASLSGLLVDPAYRRCLVCKKWGHYESECILGAEASPPLKIEASRPDKQEQVPNDKDVAHSGNLSEVESKFVVETCHGFVFEQRAISSRPNWNNEPLPEGYSAVSTMEIDGSLITSLEASNGCMP